MGQVFGITQLSLLLSCVVNTTLGVWVYLNGRDRKVNRAFCLLTLTLSGWAFSVFMVYAATTEQWMLFWGRLSFAISAFIMSSFLYFALTFPRGRLAAGWHGLLPIFLPSFVFAALSPSDLLLKRVYASQEHGFDTVHGSAHVFFTIYAFTFILTGLFNLVRKYRASDLLKERHQIKYAFIGISISASIALVTNVLMPALGSSRLSGIGPALTIIMIGFISYSIVEHRLMDIDFILKKGTTYVFLLLLLAPVLIVISMLQEIFFGSSRHLFSFLVFLLMLIPIYIIPRIRPKAEAKIERLLFRGKYDYRETLRDFSKALVSILDLKSLTKNVMGTTVDAMGVNTASLFLLDEEKGVFALQERRGPLVERISHQEIERDTPFLRWLQERGEIVTLGHMVGNGGEGSRQGAKLLKEMGAEVCVPLISKDRLIGLINFGEKKDGRPYTTEDMELLTTLANQASIAIENARLYEDLRKKEAIVRRAERLASLGTLTAGLAHEIRNPLVAIKTLTQLLPERLEDEEFRRDFVKIASGEVDRISSLVNELLEFARPASPQFRPENIPEIMEGMILLLSTETKKKNLEIVSRYERDLPPIPVDREQIKQVFLNLLLNAIEATNGGGRVTVEMRTFSKKSGEMFLQVEIRDTGRGIPQEDLEEIFTPFFTTKDKGSGLGLAISHQIIQDHGGMMRVESQVGKGSAFFIDFPIPQSAEDGVPLPNEELGAVPRGGADLARE